MNFKKLMNHPGEHALSLPLSSGTMEGVLSIPKEADTRFVVFLGHPHSLHGGTMNNKVVTTMSRAFTTLNIPNLRFDFRGVGKSQGHFDNGEGEGDDMLEVAKLWQTEFPDAEMMFAGFSFGSFVAYRAAARVSHRLLLTIAPSVENFDYAFFENIPNNWFIIQGNEDEIVPESSVSAFASKMRPPIPVVYFPDTGHFFHGKLIALRDCIIGEVKRRVPTL